MFINSYQANFFNKEVKMIHNPSNELPKLLNGLSLILDNHSILRFRTRVGKYVILHYNNVNPVLFGENNLLN